MDKVKVLEARVRELERFLDLEKKQNQEAGRIIYKKDRKLTDLTLEAEKSKNELKDLKEKVEQLQMDLRMQKRKFEEVDEISNLNQTRFRKVHQMYLTEVGKREEFEELQRRKRAVDQRTSLFVQA